MLSRISPVTAAGPLHPSRPRRHDRSSAAVSRLRTSGPKARQERLTEASPRETCQSVGVGGRLHRGPAILRCVTVSLDLGDLPGSFVVELGERQAWYFIGFCDNRPARSREARLYLDADWRLAPDQAGADAPELVRLAGVNGLTITEARCLEDGALCLTFADGVTFTVSGQANWDTVGEPWWFSPWSTT